MACARANASSVITALAYDVFFCCRYIGMARAMTNIRMTLLILSRWRKRMKKRSPAVTHYSPVIILYVFKCMVEQCDCPIY